MIDHYQKKTDQVDCKNPVRKVKLRALSLLIILVMMIGMGQTVFGSSVGTIRLGDTVHVTVEDPGEGQWYVFRPETTGHYVFYSSNIEGFSSPRCYIYEDPSDEPANSFNGPGLHNNIYNVYYLNSNTTYYIEATSSSNYFVEYDLTLSFFVNCGNGNQYNSGAYARFDFNSNYSATLRPSPEFAGDYTYSWYFDTVDPAHENVLSTESTYTVTDGTGIYVCEVSNGNVSTYVYYVFTRKVGLRCVAQNPDYRLVDAGVPEFIPMPECTSDHPELTQYLHVYTRAYPLLGDTDRSVYEYIYPEGVNGVTFPYGLTSFTALVVEMKPDYNTESVITNQEVFVYNGTPDGILSEGNSVHVDVNNHMDDDRVDYTWQQIYTYTPDRSGTATFTVDQIESGLPTMVIFDDQHRLLGQGGGNGLKDAPDWGQAVKTPFSVDINVEAGRTYYVCVPLWGGFMYCDYTVALDSWLVDYRISVSMPAAPSDDPDVPSTDPGTPSGNHTETPSGNPTGTPSGNPSDAPTSAPAVPTSNPAPVDAPVVASRGYSIGDFVERLYTVALGRSSDPAGKQDWIDAVTQRGQTGADVARGFLYSPEFLNKNASNEEFVRVLYRTFFNRDADADGLNGWVSVLDNGGTKEGVIEGFINSTEWANLCILYGVRSGGTGVPNIQVEPNQGTIDFATRLYTTCLNRPADEGGLMAWAMQLANQRDTGTGAARGFFFSSEFMDQDVSNEEYVNRLYRTFMGREADEAGFGAWVSQLNGGVSREEVFNGFAQSPEFTGICADYGILR